MDKLQLKFNPDCMSVREIKEAVLILRSLVERRKMLQGACSGDDTMVAESFLNSFDTLTQNVKA